MIERAMADTKNRFLIIFYNNTCTRKTRNADNVPLSQPYR